MKSVRRVTVYDNELIGVENGIKLNKLEEEKNARNFS